MESRGETPKHIGLQSLGDLNETVGRVPKNDLSFLLNSIIHILVWSKTEKGTDGEKGRDKEKETVRKLRHKAD